MNSNETNCKDAVCKDAVCVNGGGRNGSRAKCGHACKTDGGGKLRRLAVTAVLSALGAILMYFPKLTLPFMPSFISLDFSDLPALLAAYSMGPLSGVTVCLVKNLVSLLGSMTGGVGELSNFIISAAFVLPAGIVYKYRHDRASALWSALLGAAAAAGLSILSNCFIVYPIYEKIMSPEAILSMYRAIDPSVRDLTDAILRFNTPFTFCKELISVIITFLIYKRLSPLLHGRKKEHKKPENGAAGNRENRRTHENRHCFISAQYDAPGGSDLGQAVAGDNALRRAHNAFVFFAAGICAYRCDNMRAGA